MIEGYFMYPYSMKSWKIASFRVGVDAIIEE